MYSNSLLHSDYVQFWLDIEVLKITCNGVFPPKKEPATAFTRLIYYFCVMFPLEYL